MLLTGLCVCSELDVRLCGLTDDGAAPVARLLEPRADAWGGLKSLCISSNVAGGRLFEPLGRPTAVLEAFDVRGAHLSQHAMAKLVESMRM